MTGIIGSNGCAKPRTVAGAPADGWGLREFRACSFIVPARLGRLRIRNSFLICHTPIRAVARLQWASCWNLPGRPGGEIRFVEIVAAYRGGVLPLARLVLCRHGAADRPRRCAAIRETVSHAGVRVASPRVEESEPSIYYLPDKQGNLQPVLDFKYQDFVELYKLKNQLGRRDQPPRFSLQRMSATGTADKSRAELTVQFQISTRDGEWVRIPLRLDQGLLRGAVQYKGDGKQLVQYEGDGSGYVCWIRGKPDTQHEITLTMLVPLESVGDETRLKLSIPRATASELKLSTPVAGAVGTVSEGATLLSSAAAKGGGTEFGVVGLGGDFQLAWHKANPAAAETPVVLDATGHGVRQTRRPRHLDRGHALGAKPRRGVRPAHRPTAARGRVCSPASPTDTP